jgi:hypothetical protein
MFGSGNVSQRQAVSIKTQEDNIKKFRSLPGKISIRQYQSI